MDNAKTEDIKIVDLKNKSSIADAFIIATCRSTRHANATADELIKKLKKIGILCPNPEGIPKCDWIIVDAGSIIVHLFLLLDALRPLPTDWPHKTLESVGRRCTIILQFGLSQPSISTPTEIRASILPSKWSESILFLSYLPGKALRPYHLQTILFEYK